MIKKIFFNSSRSLSTNKWYPLTANNNSSTRAFESIHYHHQRRWCRFARLSNKMNRRARWTWYKMESMNRHFISKPVGPLNEKNAQQSKIKNNTRRAVVQPIRVHCRASERADGCSTARASISHIHSCARMTFSIRIKADGGRVRCDVAMYRARARASPLR